MPAGDVLHDVALDLVVLEHGQAPVVDEDGRGRRLEVGPARKQHSTRVVLEFSRRKHGTEVVLKSSFERET